MSTPFNNKQNKQERSGGEAVCLISSKTVIVMRKHKIMRTKENNNVFKTLKSET